jgi:transposase
MMGRGEDDTGGRTSGVLAAPDGKGELGITRKEEGLLSGWNPSKFTSNNLARIFVLLERGMSIRMACAKVGVSERTWNVWIEKCRAGNKRYSNLEEAAEIATTRGLAALYEKLLQWVEESKDTKLMWEILKAIVPDFKERKVTFKQNNQIIQLVRVGKKEWERKKDITPEKGDDKDKDD